jgi:hypothetical protein
VGIKWRDDEDGEVYKSPQNEALALEAQNRPKKGIRDGLNLKSSEKTKFP